MKRSVYISLGALIVTLLSFPVTGYADTQIYLQGISTNGTMYGFQQLFPSSGSCSVTLYESTYPDTTPVHQVNSSGNCRSFLAGTALFNESSTLTSVIVGHW